MSDFEKIKEKRRLRLDESHIKAFYPYLLLGFEHFYGKENMPLIKEKLDNIIYFPYFSKSDKKEVEIEEQCEKFFAAIEKIGSTPLEKEDKEEFINDTKEKLIEKRLQSAMLSVDTDEGKWVPVILLDMSSYNFYPRLIHECIHVIDSFSEGYGSGKFLSGFEKKEEGGEIIKGRMFNEYFTDKIAVDIFNYLLENECPSLNGEEKLDRTFFNSGPYWAPDIFMKDFYDRYKKEVCVGKLNNSFKIFHDVLGENATNKIIESCDIIPELFHFGASDEDMDKATSIKDDCKKLVEDCLNKSKKR